MLCQIEQDSNKQFMAVVLCQQSYMCFLIKPYFQYIGFWDNLGWLDQNFKYLKSEKRQNHLKRQRAHAVLSSYLWLNKWETGGNLPCITWTNGMGSEYLMYHKQWSWQQKDHIFKDYHPCRTASLCRLTDHSLVPVLSHILFLCEPTSFSLISTPHQRVHASHWKTLPCLHNDKHEIIQLLHMTWTCLERCWSQRRYRAPSSSP